MYRPKIIKKIPITLTLFRIILSVIVFIAILFGRTNTASFLFAFTAAISFIDSFFERKREIKSHIKNILDPFSDKILINLAAVALYLKGFLPFFVMAIFLVKDTLMIAGALYLLYKNPRTTFHPNRIDSITLFFQTLTIITAIAIKPDSILIWISITLTVISGIKSIIKSEIRFARGRTDLDMLRFRDLIKPPDWVTMLNALSGLFSIGFAINDNLRLAAIMLMAAIFFDWLDGKVARLTSRGGEFGKQLDSLADTISFGVAPVVFGFTVIQTNLAIISFTVFLFCGILRLARYNIAEMQGGYQGMPITLNGAIIPLVYFMSLKPELYPYIYLASAALMVSSIKVKKLI